MFGLSWAEFLVILGVALVVIGPEDLPIIVRKIRRFFHRIQNFIKNSTKEYGFDDLGKDIDEINAEVKEIIGDDGKIYEAYDVTEVEDLRDKE